MAEEKDKYLDKPGLIYYEGVQQKRFSDVYDAINENGINEDLLKLIQTMQEEHDSVNEILKEIV